MIDNSELRVFRIQLARMETNLGQTLASFERGVGCRWADSPERVAVELAPAPEEDAELPQPADPEGDRKLIHLSPDELSTLLERPIDSSADRPDLPEAAPVSVDASRQWEPAKSHLQSCSRSIRCLMYG